MARFTVTDDLPTPPLPEAMAITVVSESGLANGISRSAWPPFSWSRSPARCSSLITPRSTCDRRRPVDGRDGGGHVATEGVLHRAARHGQQHLDPDLARRGLVDGRHHAQLGDRPPDLGVVHPGQGVTDTVEQGRCSRDGHRTRLVRRRTAASVADVTSAAGRQTPNLKPCDSRDRGSAVSTRAGCGPTGRGVSGRGPPGSRADRRARRPPASVSRFPAMVIRAFHSPNRGRGPRWRRPGEGVAVHRTALARQQCPGQHDVAGRVADAAGAEVDHRRQPAVADQQVAERDVAVEPDRRSRPGAGDRGVQDLGGGRHVDLVGDARPARSGLRPGSSPGGRPATSCAGRAAGRLWRRTPAAPPGTPPPRGRRRPGRRSARVSPAPRRARRRRTRRAGSPGRATPARPAGDRHRQLRRQQRQPALLLGHLLGVEPRAGEADRQIVAESERAVVPAAVLDVADGQVRPLRELLGHQPAGEVAIGRLLEQRLTQLLRSRSRSSSSRSARIERSSLRSSERR